jgi:hypothetical protein
MARGTEEGLMGFETKSPAMQEFLEKAFGMGTAINTLTCSDCQRKIDPSEIECWDELSQREHRITGLCKGCQDVAFADPEELADEAEFGAFGQTQTSEYQDGNT